MSKMTATLMCLGLMAATGSIYAADTMGKDSMGKGGMNP